MQNEPIWTGLTTDQLARLWSIGSDCGPQHSAADADQACRDLLLDRLVSSLPPDRALIELLPEILSRLCRQLRPFAGESLRTLLLDPGMDLAVLERIKDHAKELGSNAAGEVERDVALTLYFAALAAAVLPHRTKLSQYSWSHLAQSFQALSRRPWIPADLLALFAGAADCCQEKQP